MSDPDARTSDPPVPAPEPPLPGPARALDPVPDIHEAARQLAEPLARLASAVGAAHDHLDSDPELARGQLEEARAALEALRSELATWSRR